MAKLGLETAIVDSGVYANTVRRFREEGIVLPTFAQLGDPSQIPGKILARLEGVGPDDPDPLNLFRVHWFLGADRKSRTTIPGYVELPSSLTGVDARIVVLLGERFPMITAHKVLAAYGCIVPRVITGQFDPIHNRAVWPSTGNYCRGGIAISKILQCRGVAVLPEGMSQERFDWLEHWVNDPTDIIRTYGSESNVKEIYDACNALDEDPQNIIFNQFCEFGNHLVHYHCTGQAFESVFEHMNGSGNLNLAAFVSATGSAGTIAAGDRLKDSYGTKIVAAEALECPTMLYNGFGEHNIQGIGDKHIPYIHNVMNSDFVAGISDAACDSLFLVFNQSEGRQMLVEKHGIPASTIENLSSFGLSSICNILGAVKTAKHMGLGADDVIMTVATDGAAMYGTEGPKAMNKYYDGHFDAGIAEQAFSQYMLGQDLEHLLELSTVDRNRVFNLGYFTWVEQQGVSLEDFEARRDQGYWRNLRALIPAWDALIEQFNAETGVLEAL